MICVFQVKIWFQNRRSKYKKLMKAGQGHASLGMGQPLPGGSPPPSNNDGSPIGMPGNQTPTSPSQHSPPIRDGGHSPPPHHASYIPPPGSNHHTTPSPAGHGDMSPHPHMAHHSGSPPCLSVALSPPAQHAAGHQAAPHGAPHPLLPDAHGLSSIFVVSVRRKHESTPRTFNLISTIQNPSMGRCSSLRLECVSFCDEFLPGQQKSCSCIVLK